MDECHTFAFAFCVLRLVQGRDNGRRATDDGRRLHWPSERQPASQPAGSVSLARGIHSSLE